MCRAMKTDKDTGRPNTNTDLNMDSYVNSVLANLIEWTDGGDMPRIIRVMVDKGHQDVLS